MYKKRLIEQAIVRCSKTFPVVMLTGVRQAGKTTVLKKLEPDRQFVTLDDLNLRRFAKDDPKGFLAQFFPPVFIDEFQYAPNLLSYIKILVDKKRTRTVSADGDYWLSGSQNFSMMENVSESLAGRVAILQLLGFSRAETEESHKEFEGPPFFSAAYSKFETGRSIKDLFDLILKGDKPEVLTKPEMDRHIFYSSYIQTYLERDVRNQLGVKDLGLFEKFMRLLAIRSGGLLNMASLGGDVGVSQPTILKWLTVLERSYQIFLLRPYYRGHTKRYTKTPKVYFLDTGLLSYFLGLFDSDAALSSPLSGMLFETWVVSEVIKSYWHRGLDANLFFWRTRGGDEIDLIFESGGKLFPAEIKLSASPAVNVLDAVKKSERLRIGKNRIICTTPQNMPVASDTELVSAWSVA